VVSDLAGMSSCEHRFLDFCGRIAMPNQVLIAYGTLGDQQAAEEDADATRTSRVLRFGCKWRRSTCPATARHQLRRR
jgi:hypothetical protein